MKRFIKITLMVSIVLFGTILLSSDASGVTVKKEKIEVPVVHNLDGVDKIKIYERSKQWIASNFRSAKSVIEYSNQDEGTVIGNAVIDAKCLGIFSSSCQYHFSMRIDAKDNKIKVVIFNVTYSSVTDNERGSMELPEDLYEDYKFKIDSLIESLKSYIKKEKTNKDW